MKEYLEILFEKIPKGETYGGFRLWDSPVLENPKILFIGINEGLGGPQKHILEIEPYSQFSYLEGFKGYGNDKGYLKHRMAREMIAVLKEVGFNENEIENLFINHSIRINYYSIRTNNQSNIYNTLYNTLGKEETAEFYLKTNNFVKKTILAANPQFMVLEGKSVINEIQKLFVGSIFNIRNFKYFTIFEVMENGFESKVIGYSRLFSNIKANKSELAKEFSAIGINKELIGEI